MKNLLSFLKKGTRLREDQLSAIVNALDENPIPDEVAGVDLKDFFVRRILSGQSTVSSGKIQINGSRTNSMMMSSDEKLDPTIFTSDRLQKIVDKYPELKDIDSVPSKYNLEEINNIKELSDKVEELFYELEGLGVKISREELQEGIYDSLDDAHIDRLLQNMTMRDLDDFNSNLNKVRLGERIISKIETILSTSGNSNIFGRALYMTECAVNFEEGNGLFNTKLIQRIFPENIDRETIRKALSISYNNGVKTDEKDFNPILLDIKYGTIFNKIPFLKSSVTKGLASIERNISRYLNDKGYHGNPLCFPSRDYRGGFKYLEYKDQQAIPYYLSIPDGRNVPREIRNLKAFINKKLINGTRLSVSDTSGDSFKYHKVFKNFIQFKPYNPPIRFYKYDLCLSNLKKALSVEEEKALKEFDGALFDAYIDHMVKQHPKEYFVALMQRDVNELLEGQKTFIKDYLRDLPAHSDLFQKAFDYYAKNKAALFNNAKHIINLLDHKLMPAKQDQKKASKSIPNSKLSEATPSQGKIQGATSGTQDLPTPSAPQQPSTDETAVLSAENAAACSRYLTRDLYPALDLAVFDAAKENYRHHLNDPSNGAVVVYDAERDTYTVNYSTPPHEIFETYFFNHTSMLTDVVLSENEEQELSDLSEDIETLITSSLISAAKAKRANENDDLSGEETSQHETASCELAMWKLEQQLLKMKSERLSLARERIRENLQEQLSDESVGNDMSRPLPFTPKMVQTYLAQVATDLNKPLGVASFNEAVENLTNVLGNGHLGRDFASCPQLFLSHDSISTSVLLTKDEEATLVTKLQPSVLSEFVYNHLKRHSLIDVSPSEEAKAKENIVPFIRSDESRQQLVAAVKRHTTSVLHSINSERSRRIRSRQRQAFQEQSARRRESRQMELPEAMSATVSRSGGGASQGSGERPRSQQSASHGEWHGMTLAGAVPTAGNLAGLGASQASGERQTRRAANNLAQ